MSTLRVVALVFSIVLLYVLLAEAATLTPERVTNPVILKKLDCQMKCKDNTGGLSPEECTYKCISPKCYIKTFSKLINEDGSLGKISARRAEKFQKCWEKEAAELQAAGLL